MKSRLLTLFIFATSTLLVGDVLAHNVLEFLEVSGCKPSVPVEHDVDVKSAIDETKSTVGLSGPVKHCKPVGCLGRVVPNEAACLNWYKIESNGKEQRQRVSLLDLFSGSNVDLTIGRAEFFLSPAQQIADGSPKPIPFGLDHFTAYRVIDGKFLGKSVAIKRGDKSTERVLGKPVYICIATQEWHHDEMFPATHPRTCLVVYELNVSDDRQAADKKVVTLDQFALNELALGSTNLLCVRESVAK